MVDGRTNYSKEISSLLREAYARKQLTLEKAAPEKKTSVLTKLQQAQPSKAAPAFKSNDMEL